MNTSKITLRGKRVVFSGILAAGTRKEASARARQLGCLVKPTVSKDTDFIITGLYPGQKTDRADTYGVPVLTEDEWEALVNQKPGDAQPKKTDNSDSNVTKGKNLHKVGVVTLADSDTDTEVTSLDSKSKPTMKKRITHELSMSEDDNQPLIQLRRTRSSDKLTHGTSLTKQPSLKRSHTPDSTANPGAKAATTSTAVPALKRTRSSDKGKSSDLVDKAPTLKKRRSADVSVDNKPKCQYWGKCYRKDVAHLRKFLHPAKDETPSCAAGSSSNGVTKRAPRVSTTTTVKTFPLVQLLLAHKWEEKVNPKGWWMSEKLDGVRAYWNGKSFYSRLGNPFTAPDWFTQGFPTDMSLDGELFGGRGKFQSTVSIVKTRGSPKWKSLTYQVFDVPNIGLEKFERRMSHLQEYFDKESPPYASIVAQTKCKDVNHLKEEMEKVLDMGGEGVMVRQPGSQYENQRSHTLLKYKKFYDAEAVVIGHEKGKGKNQNKCGALRCEMECGKIFYCGSGLTDADRSRPPKKGSIITYKFQELTDSGAPRFPSYIGIRIDMDKPKDADIPKKKKVPTATLR